MDARAMIDMPVHPAADAFPMLDPESLTGLENDIKANGQASPVIVWNGQIVDGRNRYAVCVRSRIKPKLKHADFKDDAECVRYIISTNIHRRHLTLEDRAEAARKLANLKVGRPGAETASGDAISDAEAAKRLDVSSATVERMKHIAKEAPDLHQEVLARKKKIGTAYREARERKRQPAPQTDPDRADDAVVDKKIERAADGYTPKMEKVWAAYSALDAVEQTAFKERLNQ